MEITQQELFDALTAHHKNEWKKVYITRSGGIRVGNSKWYLIRERKSYCLFVYKHDDNYDLSDFESDFQTSKGRGTQWSVHWNFHGGDIDTVKHRKEVSRELWVRMINLRTESLEEESPATEVA